VAAFERYVQQKKKDAQAEALLESDEAAFVEGLLQLEFQPTNGQATITQLLVPKMYRFAQLHEDGARYFQVRGRHPGSMRPHALDLSRAGGDAGGGAGGRAGAGVAVQHPGAQ